MLQVSYSGLSVHGQCPRKYRYIYEDRRITIPKFDALAIGSVVHEGLAQMVMGRPLDLRAYSGNVSPEDSCAIIAMLECWPRRWEDYFVVGTEMPFEVKIRNPQTGYAIRGIRYRGFVDAVLKDPRTEEVIILEHKTTSEQITGFGPYWSRLAIDDQIALYRMVWGADRIIYNVGRKPKLRPSAVDKAKGGDILDAFTRRLINLLTGDPHEWYAWREIHKTDDEMADAAQGLYDRARKLLEDRKQGRWPRQPGACRHIYGVCQYLDVCTGRARLDDDALFMDREDR